MNAAINFAIYKNGTVGKNAREQFEARKPDGSHVAAIVPRHMGEYMREYHETQFMVLYPNGKVEVADDIEHASDLIGERIA